MWPKCLRRKENLGFTTAFSLLWVKLGIKISLKFTYILTIVRFSSDNR